MTREQIAVVKGLMNASKKCANTYMKAIDTLKDENRPVPEYWNRAYNLCLGAVTSYDNVLNLVGETQSGLWVTDEIDEGLYQMLIERK